MTSCINLFSFSGAPWKWQNSQLLITSAGTTGYASILPSLLEFLCNVDPERTLAEMCFAKRQGECARRRTIFEAFEIVVQAKIFCSTEVGKAVLGAVEILGTFHMANHYFDLLSNILIHGLHLITDFFVFECAEIVIYQTGSRTKYKVWHRKHLFGMLPDL